jgi:hypothetical protein
MNVLGRRSKNHPLPLAEDPSASSCCVRPLWMDCNKAALPDHFDIPSKVEPRNALAARLAGTAEPIRVALAGRRRATLRTEVVVIAGRVAGLDPEDYDDITPPREIVLTAIFCAA